MLTFSGSRPQAIIRNVVTIAVLIGTTVSLLGAQASTGSTSPTSATPTTTQSTSSLLSASSTLPIVAQPQGELERRNTPPAIEGWVKSMGAGQPVAGATVSLDGRIRAMSDASGYFRFERGQVGADEVQGSKKVAVEVSAPGYASWSLGSVTYYVHDTLRVYPKLGSTTQTFVAKSVDASSVRFSPQPALAHRQDREGVGGASLASMNAAPNDGPNAAPPASIRVYRTQSGVVEVVPFREYLKHTLPNEWIPSWRSDALKAGAMAVKTYAWYWVARGGKQVALGADVKDNVEDQVYDPNVSYASTDAAVDATYNYAMLRNGSVFQAQYCAGSYIADPTGDCPWPGPYMTQWGSAYYADQGKGWAWILGFYYTGAVIYPSPGGGYNGTPVPQGTLPPAPTRQPTATPLPMTYVVGQGSNQADVYAEVYARNGGEAALGKPTGPVRWWMGYLSEYNVQAQPFAGPQGRGDVWIVYDVLKSDPDVPQRAFVVTGEIARAYKNHTPTGPEWVGAPTSDPYTAGAQARGLPSQSFTRGMLQWDGQRVLFTPWQSKEGEWRAEYFTGYQPALPGAAPQNSLPGQAAYVTSYLTPSFQWSGDLRAPQGMGVGEGAWSVQMTREVQSLGEGYDFTLSANSGARLWVDGLLAINGWNWVDGGTAQYNADLSAGPHTIRVQYYNTSAARDSVLNLTFGPTSAASPTPTAAPLMPGSRPSRASIGSSGLRVRVTWLGREPGSNGWVQPVTLLLSDPQSGQTLHTYAAQTDRNGVAYFGDLPSGNYDVNVKGESSLPAARGNVLLPEKAVADLDVEALIGGDLNRDNCVGVDDFSIVQSMLGASHGTPGYNPQADLNGDGAVTMSDVSLLRAGFDRCGAMSDEQRGPSNEFTTLTTLSPDALLPWTEPDRLDHDLSMELVASSTKAQRGQTVEVKVVAETGEQPVDGASFVVSYDPKKLKPVDTAGKEIDGTGGVGSVEPGVALPAVMGNWLDKKGGSIGYSAGVLQGDPPQGRIVVATLRFRVISGTAGTTNISFAPLPSPNMQLTNGGVNLLARVAGIELTLAP